MNFVQREEVAFVGGEWNTVHSSHLWIIKYSVGFSLQPCMPSNYMSPLYLPSRRSMQSWFCHKTSTLPTLHRSACSLNYFVISNECSQFNEALAMWVDWFIHCTSTSLPLFAGSPSQLRAQFVFISHKRFTPDCVVPACTAAVFKAAEMLLWQSIAKKKKKRRQTQKRSKHQERASKIKVYTKKKKRTKQRTNVVSYTACNYYHLLFTASRVKVWIFVCFSRLLYLSWQSQRQRAHVS